MADVTQKKTSSPLPMLRRVFELEARQGYSNRAAIGGIVRIWEKWRADLLTSFSDAGAVALIDALTERIGRYDLASPSEREETLKEAHNSFDRLERGTHASAVAPSASLKPLAIPLPPQAAEKPAPKTALPPARPTATFPIAPKKPSRQNAATLSASVDSSVTFVPGVGPTNSEKLAGLGIKSIRDLLYYFPARHIDYRDIRLIADLIESDDSSERAYQTVTGTILSTKADHLRGKSSGAKSGWLFSDLSAPRASRGGLIRIATRILDDSGTIDLVWLRPKDYMSRELTVGRRIIVSGEVRPKFRDEGMEFSEPDFEFVGASESIHTGRLVPVYRKNAQIAERWLRKTIKAAIDGFCDRLEEHLPESTRLAANLMPLREAIRQAHFPDSPELLEEARQRLAFDELFLIQLSVLERRAEWQSGPPAPEMRRDSALFDRFLETLPYQLTDAQRRVLDEITLDLAQARPMSRLLQGEVGSGKTVVAAGAIAVAIDNGYQAALMAPTEILAEQHFRGIKSFLEDQPIFAVRDDSDHSPRGARVALLVGSLKKAEKRDVYARIAKGEVDLVVGTHALIQEGVEFHKLGLAIVDEQHRFGVLQRTTLREKGTSPHLLVMTATPIPRTLALTLYGDLDLSIIDELPPGRQEIRTKCFGPTDRQRVYEGVRTEVQKGHQGFIICPLVEESERLEARAAVVEFERLKRDIYPELRLGLLHGKMKPTEKETTMRSFSRGEIDILVATSVIEVGIDVPNATVILIEGAERFGLAQLHQFRGRVGRGSARSYCALLSDQAGGETRERLETVARTRDGFKLAEEDLKLRGPGEFFGTRQSGLPDLKMARGTDTRILELARTLAQSLHAADPSLGAPENSLLARRIEAIREPEA